MDHHQKPAHRERPSHCNHILAAALELFSEKGYHNVSLREIANRATSAIGSTLHRFFANKEGPYKALMDNGEGRRIPPRTCGGTCSGGRRSERSGQPPCDEGNAFYQRRRHLTSLSRPDKSHTAINIKGGLDKDIRMDVREIPGAAARRTGKRCTRRGFLQDFPPDKAVALEGLVNTFLYRCSKLRRSNPTRRA